MGFVSFLKQFGLDLLKGVQIAEGLAPLAQGAIAAVSPTAAAKVGTFEQMAAAGLQIEGSFAAAFGPTQQTGAAKFAALSAQMPQIVLSSEALVGKKVADEALFTKAMQEYTQATADLLNSLHSNSSTSNPAGAPSIAPANLPVPPVVAPSTPTTTTPTT